MTQGIKDARCELVMTCPYYNNDTYGMPEIYKDRYCREDYRWCGRYMAFKSLERELWNGEYRRINNKTADNRVD